MQSDIYRIYLVIYLPTYLLLLLLHHFYIVALQDCLLGSVPCTVLRLVKIRQSDQEVFDEEW